MAKIEEELYQLRSVPSIEYPEVEASQKPLPSQVSVDDTSAAKWATTGLLSALSLALNACGGGGSSGSSPTTSGVSAAAVVIPLTDANATRFLQQAQFSSDDNDIASVKSLGYAAWYDAQVSAPLGQTGWDWLTSRGYDAIDTNRYYFSHMPGDCMIWNQLIAGPDQIRKRLALALSEMMVVSFTAITDWWPSHLIAAYWDVLTANVFGNFRVLMEEITLNPAVGTFLNTKDNLKEDAKTGRQPDENYAREFMQLFTIGLYEINTDGSYLLDSAGNRIETYTQSDVSSLAHIFTGYSFDMSKVTYTNNTYSAGNTDRIGTTEFAHGHMAFTASNHSTLAVTFLGVTIPANTGGTTALKITLDTVYNHKNLGPFFARQMIERLVTSNPSSAYIGRVAAIFNDNGSGVRGDLKAVWKAILTDSEATAVATAATGGKLREPMIRFVQLARTLGAATTTGAWQIGDLTSDSTALGQSPLRASSVFNFFRPGYVPPNTALATNGLVAPEFQLVNESAVAGYLNYIMAFINKGANDVQLDYSGLLTLAPDAAGLLAWLNLRLSANQISATTLAYLQTALEATNVTAASTDTAKLDRVKTACLLVMACPEYLVQK